MDIELDEITVRTLSDPDEVEIAQDSLELGHYLGNCRPHYRRLYQVTEYKGRWLGVLLWDQCVSINSARDAYIGWDTEARRLHRTEVVNNRRFCIGKEFQGVQNLGSKILGLAVKALPEAWCGKYGEEVLLCETYVDPELYIGTSYTSAGWEYIGDSAGYDKRNKDTGKYETTHPKKVFLKPLNDKAKELLCLPYRRIDAGHRKNGQHNSIMEVDFSKLDLSRLRQRLESIPDHRSAQGRRYGAASLMMSVALAIFTGCSGYQAIWHWLGNLAPSFSKSLGLRTPPSVSTISRFMRNINVKFLNEAVYGWLIEQTTGLLDQNVLSFDGKVLRGSKDSEGQATELLSAVLAPIGITVAQALIKQPNGATEDERKTNEIPVMQNMLEKMPESILANKIVVADAIHTQTKTANIIVKKKPISCSASKVIKAIS